MKYARKEEIEKAREALPSVLRESALADGT